MLLGCIPTLKQEWRKISISPISTSDTNRLRLMVESTWINLEKAKYQGASFNPKTLEESNFIELYDYLRSFLSMNDLAKMLGVPIFISGPHTDSTLALTDKYQFGHYHPEFPIRLRKFFIPAVNNSTIRSLTQKNYNSYLKRFARTFFAVYQKLNSNSDFYDKEVLRYTELIADRRLDPYYFERFILFMKIDYTDGEDLEESAKFQSFKEDEKLDEDLVKLVVGFWIRRRIDQTDFLFYQGLIDLIKVYDTEFLDKRLE